MFDVTYTKIRLRRMSLERIIRVTRGKTVVKSNYKNVQRREASKTSCLKTRSTTKGYDDDNDTINNLIINVYIAK